MSDIQISLFIDCDCILSSNLFRFFFVKFKDLSCFSLQCYATVNMMNDEYQRSMNNNELIEQRGKLVAPPRHRRWSHICCFSDRPRPPLGWAACYRPFLAQPLWSGGQVSSVRRPCAPRPWPRCTWSPRAAPRVAPWSPGSRLPPAPPARCRELWRSSRLRILNK